MAYLVGTGVCLPARLVSTDGLLAAHWPERDAAKAKARLGIETRGWLGEGESAASLATAAVRQALAAAGLAAESIRRLILVTSTGGDQLIPATANAVLEALGLDDSCDAFDVQNSCAGFLTGLDLAARSVDTGLGPTVVVAVETFSRDISVHDPRTYLVLADAAAAAVVSAEGPGLKVVMGYLANTSRLRGQMRQPHLHRDPVGHIRFDSPAEAIGESAIHHLKVASERVLASAGLSWGDVRWFLPHQPNGALLEELLRRLPVDRSRTFPVVQRVGSVASAAVPLSLHGVLALGTPAAGDHFLLASVGSGTAYGAILLTASK